MIASRSGFRLQASGFRLAVRARSWRRASGGFGLALVLLVGTACPGSRRAGPRLGGVPVDEHGKPIEGAPLPAQIEIVHEDRTITVELPGAPSSTSGPAPASGPAPTTPASPTTPATPDATTPPPIIATLGAVLTRPKDGKGPAILIVPGAGDVSRTGTRPSDGFTMYPKPVDVSVLWGDAFAKRGALTLRWDKRTCGPNDDPACAKNPQDDIDAQGPGALARDVDAACALIAKEPQFDGRIVLFAHGQAAQVALTSQCAQTAAAVVLLAPIPRAIDEVMVAGLRDRLKETEAAAKAEKDETAKAQLVDKAAKLRNLAGTREAEFAAIKAGRFAPTARVTNATVGFWKGWMELTGKTAALVDAVPAKKIVVLGAGDLQYGDKDRVRIRALGDAFVEAPGADHHLLTSGKLDDATVDAIGKAIEAALPGVS